MQYDGILAISVFLWLVAYALQLLSNSDQDRSYRIRLPLILWIMCGAPRAKGAPKRSVVADMAKLQFFAWGVATAEVILWYLEVDVWLRILISLLSGLGLLTIAAIWISHHSINGPIP